MIQKIKLKLTKVFDSIKNIKHFMTYIFLLGFAIDFLTLPSPDTSISWIIGIIYMLAVGLAILLREYFEVRSKFEKRDQYIGYAYAATSFFMGSLLSFVFVYYFRSSDSLIGLPIIIGLLVFVILNELINSRSVRLLFDTALYFLGSFFFLIFLIPIFVGTVNDKAFIVSAIVTILYFISYFYTLSYLCKVKLNKYKSEILICLGILFLVLTLFIFKILPAVPLSLKDSGVYISISKSGTSYNAIKEKKSFISNIISPKTYNISAGQDLYFYSSVHAPTSINTVISHTWEYYDSKSGKWIIYNKIPFKISGGREGGYRAYTQKSNLTPGKWRVVVRNDDERVIGRYTFTLKSTDKIIKQENVSL